jgi:hypothetical protein
METKNLPKRDSSTRFLASDFFNESNPYGFLIHTQNLEYHTPLNKFLRGIIPLETNFRGQKSRATVQLKPLKCENHLVVKKYIIYSYSTAKKCRKLQKWSFQVADFRKNRDCGIAVAEKQFFKNLRNCNCGSVSFKLRNCNCGLEKVVHDHLW